MPLGNGQVGINLWVEEDGDLRFYISRTDSLTEASRLVKVGGVRISLDPNPFKKGMPFRQELKLADGVCEITAGEGSGKVTLTVLRRFQRAGDSFHRFLGLTGQGQGRGRRLAEQAAHAYR